MKFRNIRQFTIDRRVWLRGEGPVSSYLLRKEDQKMCCVGMYLQACGVSRRMLENRHAASQIPKKYASVAWLRDSERVPEALYAANDDNMKPRVRERIIATLFKQFGNVVVKFVH